VERERERRERWEGADAETFMRTHIWGPVIYYESIKRELKRRLIYEYRCDERLKLRNLHASQTMDWSWNWNT
jgi:hypothetical protein